VKGPQHKFNNFVSALPSCQEQARRHESEPDRKRVRSANHGFLWIEKYFQLIIKEKKDAEKGNMRAMKQ